MMNPLQKEELLEVEEMSHGVFGENAEQPNFEITDLESLMWAFRKLSYYQEKKEEKKELSKKARERLEMELYRLNEWEAKELEPINNDISYFESLIQQYHSKVINDDPNQKTLSTPFGKSKSTTSKAQPDKKDEEQLIKFVEENKLPFIKKVTTKTLQWGELKKTLQIVEKNGEQIIINENGQQVPGATVKPQTTTFKVEI